MPMQTLEEESTSAAELAAQHLLRTGRVTIESHPGDPRWQLAYRIATSGGLGRSRLLARFLLFIVDRHIRGRADEITERQIGILIFDRPERYDSNEDNIVRSYARNLRRRISDYYASEGCKEPLYLEIPRGGYAPAFTPRDSFGDVPAVNGEDVDCTQDETLGASAEDELAMAPAPPGFGSAWRASLAAMADFFAADWFLRRHRAVFALCVGIAIGLAVAAVQSRRHGRQGGSYLEQAASNSLWRQIFMSDRDTFIVPSDDGLVILQRLTERPVPLASYISGAYRNNPNIQNDPSAAEILKLGARRYTSVVDLDFATHLAQVDAVDPARMIVRYARDLRMDDLRAGNSVLIGSVESNPWIQLFEPEMNFRLRISTDPRVPSGFVNTRSLPGEHELYGTPDNDHTYGRIAYLPNLTSTGHVLVVGGLNTAGTQAATTFLLTPSLMAPLLQHARTRRGEFLPFEVLISAGNFSSNASAPQIIAERIGTR